MKNCIKVIVPIILALFLIAVIACSTTKPTINAPSFPASAPQTGRGTTAVYDAAQPSFQGDTSNTVDRKLVKTGTLTLEVNDISKIQDEITALAIQMNGYVVSSNQSGEEDKEPGGFISIRIPVDKFDEALQKIKPLAVKVLYETTNSQDVTEQYTDLNAQLHNLEATEAQYLELLKKADNVKDMLDVQRELSNVRGNIDSIKGRIQYLDRTSDMSLIEVTLKKNKPVGESKWDVLNILKSAVDGLVTFGQVIVTIIIWLLVFAPVWIIILVIIFLIRRRKKARAVS